MTNPVFTGIAYGLKPDHSDPETVTVDLDLLRAAERLRVIKAVELQARTAEAALVERRRIADAAERQADALEAMARLFGSTIGIGNVTCGDKYITNEVNFIRTGTGRKDFRCDTDSIANADDSD